MEKKQKPSKQNHIIQILLNKEELSIAIFTNITQQDYQIQKKKKNKKNSNQNRKKKIQKKKKKKKKKNKLIIKKN